MSYNLRGVKFLTSKKMTTPESAIQEQSFNTEQVKEIIQRVQASTIKSGEYQPEKAREHLSNILHEILSQLKDLNFRFKYCASGIITQNCGAALYQAVSAKYEKSTDNFIYSVYTKENVLCAVTVYGFKI